MVSSLLCSLDVSVRCFVCLPLECSAGDAVPPPPHITERMARSLCTHAATRLLQTPHSSHAASAPSGNAPPLSLDSTAAAASKLESLVVGYRDSARGVLSGHVPQQQQQRGGGASGRRRLGSDKYSHGSPPSPLSPSRDGPGAADSGPGSVVRAFGWGLLPANAGLRVVHGGRLYEAAQELQTYVPGERWPAVLHVRVLLCRVLLSYASLRVCVSA